MKNIIIVSKKDLEDLRFLVSVKKEKLGDAKKAAIVAFATVFGKFLPECRIRLVP